MCVLSRSSCAIQLLVASMSGRATIQTESARSATTSLLDEGIDQDHSVNSIYPQRVLRTLLEDFEEQSIANTAG